MNISPRKRMTYATALSAIVLFKDQMGIDLDKWSLAVLGGVACVFIICQTWSDTAEARRKFDG